MKGSERKYNYMMCCRMQISRAYSMAGAFPVSEYDNA